MLNLNKKKTYLLACSYGPDSMALFQMLLNEGYCFSVAHVNYHLREESTKETESLKRFCNEKHVPIFIYDVKETIEKNIEEKCREIRYQFFADILYNHKGFDSVLVGHHQDDLIETYLLQKQRNILPRHYGLNEENIIFGIKVIRPLLDCKKSELEAFCKENQIPYALDSSNFLDAYSRNKIRHEVVQKMSDEDRRTIIAEIDKENKKLATLYKEVDALGELSNEDILKLSPNTFRLYLTKMAKEIVPDFEVSKKVAIEIRKVLLSAKPNVITPVTKELCFYKEYETCFFDFVEKDENYSYLIEKPCVIDTPFFYLDFSGDTSNRNVNDSSYPIIVRNAHLEDIVPINNYKVKVRRLFIDWKMPLSLRKRWPVILNKDNEVIYIPRYQKDFVPNEQSNFYVKKRFSLKK